MTAEVRAPELDPASRLALAIVLRAMDDWRHWCETGQVCSDYEWPWPHLTPPAELCGFFTSRWFEDLCVGLRIGRDTVYAYLADMWQQAQANGGKDG